MRIFTTRFTTREELKKEINKRLDSEEKKASARLFPREELDRLLEAVESQPFGYSEGDGGHVALSYSYSAETTYFEFGWYTWRKVKYYSFSAYRGRAKHVRYGIGGGLYINQSRKDAYKKVFPDRYKKLTELITQRRISRTIRQHQLPPCPVQLIDIRVNSEDNGLVVGRPINDSWAIVGTPAGWIQTRKMYREKRSAWLLLKDMGSP